MNYLTQLFNDLRNLTDYAPGADGTSSINDLQGSARSAHKRVTSIITKDVYDAIIASKNDELMDPLRSAMANMTLSIQLSFDVINRRKNDVDVYKYELEGMKRSYSENYYNAMDSLIAAIESINDDSSPVKSAWKDSRYHKLIYSCKIKSASDFDVIYNIDSSQLFFFRTLPIQKEVIDSRLGGYFAKVQDNDRVESMLLLVLAKKVVATALRRFDILECPSTIRNLFDDSQVSGQRKDERESATALASLLDTEAESLLSDLDAILSADTSLDVSSMSAYNQPDDNIVMMP